MNWLAYTSKELRASAILTSSYVAWSVLWLDDKNLAQELNQSVLFIDFTKGSLTSMELKIEFSDDGVKFFQQSFIDISWGTATVSAWEYTFTATGTYEISNPYKARYMRVLVKWTGTATNSACSITWIIGIA